MVGTRWSEDMGTLGDSLLRIVESYVGRDPGLKRDS